MLGKWDSWHKNVKRMSSFRYGNTITYQLAEDFLKGMEVEDWGCGTGGFKRLHKGGYIGVDGTQTPFVDKIVDLRNYKSSVDGIMMRHVIEHNYDWKTVLENAVFSFKKKFCLVLFTPFTDETKVIAQNKKFGVDVPNISFNKKDLESCFEGLTWKLTENIKTRSGYSVEHVYFLEKKNYTERLRIAVITANLSNNQKPIKNYQQSIPVDYFHFTDENFPPRIKAMTAQLQTKIVKMFSWQIVPYYHYYLWVGDSKYLKSRAAVKKFLDKCEDVAVLKNNSDVFMYRNCLQTQEMLKEWWYYTSRNDSVDEPFLNQVLSESKCKVSIIEK